MLERDLSQGFKSLKRRLKRIALPFSKKSRGSSTKVNALSASGLFDRNWYLARYPDVAAAGIDPIKHYLKLGAAEGRDPGPGFDTLWYLETNPDVAQSGINPLYHFAMAGRMEGRSPRPNWNPVRGLPQTADAAQPSGDVLAGTIEQRIEQDGVLDLLRACDPVTSQIIELNLEAWSALTDRASRIEEPITIVVAHNEVSHAHGTGVLIKRMFGKLNSVLTIRPWSSFDNRDEIGFANVWLGNKILSDQQLLRLFSFLLAGQRARCVVAVPYDDMDLRVAQRAAEFLSAPLVPYIMDDNNVVGRRIRDDTMSRAVRSAAVRFVIGVEMRQAYEWKFRDKFYVLPPLVSPSLMNGQVAQHADTDARGVIVGNIWRQTWLDEILKVVETSGIALDWICNTEDPKWLTFDRTAMAKRGIHFRGPMPEAELVARVRQSPYCVMPTLSGSDDESSVALARLSLPSRIILVIAACQTPIIVIGDPSTTAAKFVRRFGVGLVADHEAAALKAAIASALDPVKRAAMRANASNIAAVFSSEGIEDWFFSSVAAGRAIDDRFDALLSTPPGEIAYFIDPPCPTTVGYDQRDAYRALRRIKARGFEPDFVLDAGASNGIWSHSISHLFPNARFLLIEPLFSRYQATTGTPLVDGHRNFEVAEVALSDRDGEMVLQVSGDLYNSSALGVRLTGVSDTVTVPSLTLDRLAHERRFKGRGLLKIDVQFAEHLVLDGAGRLLSDQVDAVIIEMTLRREHPDALTLLEICNKMKALGFDYEDDAGEWRSPIDGQLEQKDVLFVRHGAFFE